MTVRKMPAVKYSHHSWQYCRPRPHISLASVFLETSFQVPVFLLFSDPPSISASLWGTPQVWLLPSPSSSLPLQYWAIFLTQMPTLFPYQLLLYASLPFLSALLVIISTVFLMVSVSILLVTEHAYVVLWIFVFKMPRGGVPMYTWAVFTFVYLCRYLHSRGTGAEGTMVVCISGLRSWTWTLHGCDLVRMEYV